MGSAGDCSFPLPNRRLEDRSVIPRPRSSTPTPEAGFPHRRRGRLRRRRHRDVGRTRKVMVPLTARVADHDDRAAGEADARSSRDRGGDPLRVRIAPGRPHVVVEVDRVVDQRLDLPRRPCPWFSFAAPLASSKASRAPCPYGTWIRPLTASVPEDTRADQVMTNCCFERQSCEALLLWHCVADPGGLRTPPIRIARD